MTKSDPPTIDVNPGFELLAKNTELSLGEYTLITQSQADIEFSLLQPHSTFSTVLYGAFSRKTMVSPLAGSIVDMLVVYREHDVKNILPSQIFKRLSTRLIEKYPDATVIDRQSTLMLPVNNFQYKIRPAYPVSGHVYMLPDETFNEWVKYDITSYNDIFIKENVRHKGRLIELIRMIKTWNRVSGNLFNGYYLELLVTSVLTDHEINHYSETVCYIFNAALSEVVFQKHDPANTAFQVEGLNDIDDLITAMRLLKRSHQLAVQAIEFENEGNVEAAINSWNKLFPRVFPTRVDMLVGRARSAGIKGADALRMMIDHKP